ncbi:MAG: hypothetical protein ABMA25_06010 [Ilumatobacteraceae bacterium]
MHRIAATALGVIALAAIAVGCGDDSSATDTVASTTTAAPETTVVDETIVDATLIDDTLVDETTGGDAPGAGSEFCTINESLNESASAAIDGDGTPEVLQEFFEVEFPAQFAEMTAAAPADLTDDMAVLGEGFTALGQLFADNEWDLEASFNDPALTDVLDNQAYVDAGTAVDAYCGA